MYIQNVLRETISNLILEHAAVFSDNPTQELWLKDAGNYVYQNSRHPNASKYLEQGNEAIESLVSRWAHKPVDVKEFFGQLALAFFKLRESQAA